MEPGLSLTEGFNHTEYHPQLIENYTRQIELVAAAGYTNLICFSGNRNGMDDETGLQNCVAGLKQILPLAEEKGVVLQMELFNSKVDHPDYMCDNTAWGIELCKRLDSPNFKLLYDIYHMQIEEGDIIRTIRENHRYFGHYHTAGVPGRHEIEENQELFLSRYYEGHCGDRIRRLCRSGIYSNTEDPTESLRKAIALCDV